MTRYRHLLALTTAVGLFAVSGASCPQRVVPLYRDPLPRVLPASPSLDQVIQAVNRNSQLIQSFSADRATVTGQGFPSLRAFVAFERPTRFRLRADTALTGPEVDVGSNDELFWFWVRRNEPRAVYFCRHSQLATSPARQSIPIEPQWLIEAMGIVEFDPRLPHQGPFPLPGERVQVRTVRETASGTQTKITVVDSLRGAVLEQQVYDSCNRLVASAQESGHRRDPLTGAILPTVVTVRSVPAQMALRIDLGDVQINRLEGSSAGLWGLPNYEGYPAVDLCGPAYSPPNVAPPPSDALQPNMAPPPTVVPPPQAAYPAANYWQR